MGSDIPWYLNFHRPMWYSWRKMYLNTTFIFMQCLIIVQETNEVQFERKKSALQYSLQNET